MKFKNLFILFLASAVTAFGQDNAAQRLKNFNLEKGVAIQGYDPVSYFAPGKPQHGSSNISFTWQGVTYHFFNQANKEAFIKNPSMYEPQYGGWCAFAMGDNGNKVEVNPETFKIADGKLFLFYNAFFNNTLKSWNKDEKSLNAKADLNWKKYSNTK